MGILDTIGKALDDLGTRPVADAVKGAPNPATTIGKALSDLGTRPIDDIFKKDGILSLPWYWWLFLLLFSPLILILIAIDRLISAISSLFH